MKRFVIRPIRILAGIDDAHAGVVEMIDPTTPACGTRLRIQQLIKERERMLIMTATNRGK